MQQDICARKKSLPKSSAQFFLPISSNLYRRQQDRVVQQNLATRYATGRIIRLLSLCLIPLLATSCLTTKSANAPAFRGLTNSEAQTLGSLNHQNIQDKPSPKDKDKDKDDSPESLSEMAEMFLQNGDYERSLYNYSKILSQNPERDDVRYKMAVALLLDGKREEAKQELATVLLHRNDMVEAHEALGMVYLEENNLTASPGGIPPGPGPESRPLPGSLFFGRDLSQRQQQYSQALPEFKAALAIVPGSARVMSAIGWSCFKLKEYDQSLQWLKKAKAIDPNNPKVNYRLGMVLAAQKKYPEALEAFRQSRR